MHGLVKKLLVSAAIFGAFYLAGNIAIYCENFHDSLFTSSAVFGFSFVSLLGGATKLWYELFG